MTGLSTLGFTKFERAFPTSWIDQVLGPPLADAAWLAHPQIAPILASVLGEGYIMGRAGLDMSIPRTSLFGDPRDLTVPAIGLALHVALAAGTLQVVPGSHASPARMPTTVDLAPGDCVLYDTRLRVEPAEHRALVSAYYRSWFREPVGSAPPLSVSLVTFLRVPGSQRHLFSWRFDRYAKLRPRLFLDRFLRQLPASLQDRLARRR